ncbi:MAG: NADH-quinone oxidoreductase subunit M [Planctomycetes bacterium]|nr:NADH-quinone oxidoreductase subunit M [Planctomycetota bacterium]
MESWILTIVIFTPLVGGVLLMLPPYGNNASVRRSALFYSLLTLGISLLALFKFYEGAPANSYDDPAYLLTHRAPWNTGELIDIDGLAVPSIDIAYHVGVDGISIWLVVLATLLMPLAILSGFRSIRTRVREYYCLLLFLETGLLGVFCAMDLLFFYVCFEFTLIPLYFLIGIWGGSERRRAANKFFIFTLAGSVLTFAGVLYLAYYSYTTLGYLTLNIEKLIELGQGGFLPYNLQWWLFLAFAAGFAIKVPLFPVHTWLPLAHTEAPTAGSVILAGVLLKLGTYGFCRLSIPMFPDASRELAPTIAVLAIIGIIYAALAAWVQKDIKKLVAYSSVSHLGFCMLGLFSLKVAGVSGGVLYMVNHGLSTGALFLIVGFIYERYHTRKFAELGGLARPMPWLAFFLIFFTLSSIGLPGLNGFVGEFLVLLATATSATTDDGIAAGPLGYAYAIPAALGIILSAVYMLRMCQRLLFGSLVEPAGTPDTSTGLSKDLTRREIGILTPIALCCLAIGVYPKPLLDTFEVATRQHVLRHPAPRTRTDAGTLEQQRSASLRRSVASTAPAGDLNKLSTPTNRASVGLIGASALISAREDRTPNASAESIRVKQPASRGGDRRPGDDT